MGMRSPVDLSRSALTSPGRSNRDGVAFSGAGGGRLARPAGWCPAHYGQVKDPEVAFGEQPAAIRDAPLTFLFTDVESSTRLWEQNPESMRSALARHEVILRSAIADSAGEV